MPQLTHAQLLELKRWNTPTIYNGWEQITSCDAGAEGFNLEECRDFMPQMGPMVGYAVTLKIEPSVKEHKTVGTAWEDYREYMASLPGPKIAVIEDLDGENAIGAYWGEINTEVHKGFGMAGALTNGVMRDLGDLPADFPVVAGSVGPSHGFVHVRDFDEPVTVFGLTIHPGDLVHADRHGAVVIPAEVIGRLEAAIDKLMATERIVLDAARAPGFDFDRFERAWSEFEAART